MDKMGMQLYNIGFSEEEADHYRRLSAAGECSNPERLRMLADKRKATLDEIHQLEGRIAGMDVLRQEIRKKA